MWFYQDLHVRSLYSDLTCGKEVTLCGSSDADRETALVTHDNVDDAAQLSSDSCHNSK